MGSGQAFLYVINVFAERVKVNVVCELAGKHCTDSHERRLLLGDARLFGISCTSHVLSYTNLHINLTTITEVIN
jgi:hypothetical protein